MAHNKNESAREEARATQNAAKMKIVGSNAENCILCETQNVRDPVSTGRKTR